jgi:hypothetical protein
MGMSARFALFVVVLLVAQAAFGQGDRGPRDRGMGGFSRRNGGSTSEQDRAARMTDFVRRIDVNGNGMIDADEVNNGQNSFAARMLSRSGIELNYPIPISKVVESMTAASRSQDRSYRSDPTRPSQPPPSSPPSSPASQFGAASLPASATPGFAQPASATANATDPSLEQKIRAFAAALIQKVDKNGDARLDRDEWASQGKDTKWGTFDEANRQGGSFISARDLVTHLLDCYRRQPFPLDSAGSQQSLGRKSWRSLSPGERMPKGLPDWFLKKDADGDGQVTMAEFSTSWTASLVAEFDGYDLNHDGMIVPAEALKTVVVAHSGS